MSSNPHFTSSPDRQWLHYPLYQRVRTALFAIPAHFSSETRIDGLVATDLQTLNQVIGATTEQQVVATLNNMRAVWDPNEEYLQYSFRRQAQVFPDVLLISEDNGHDIILGIELKSWYLLAKERMPNFRFQVTPSACAPADLLAIIPWSLRNVLSGQPVTYKPYVTSARGAAEYRNHWWTGLRETKSDRRIHLASDVRPYPAKSDPISDRPYRDGGNNFGRLARTGLMDDYIAEMLATPLAGVPVGQWLDFLKQVPQ